MPVIDLGSVVGPQGPQGATGATGAQGIQGNPGPNQVTDQTSTNLNGVLFGNQSRVTVKPVDSDPTADSTNLVSSGGTNKAIKGRVPVYGKGVNLLRNWYFVGGGTGRGVFPVNQRGVISGTTANNTYGIDAWKWTYNTRAGSWALNSTGLTLTPDSASDTVQMLEYLKSTSELNGKSITASILRSDGTLKHGTITRNSSITQFIVDESDVGLRIFADGHFRIYVRTTQTIVAVKLELGTEQTLCHNEGTAEAPVWVLNEVPDYEYELYRCMTSTADPGDPYANKTLATGQELAYVENGTTASRAYAIGDYFCWHGLLYRAKTAIGNGDTFTENTNCEVVTGGGINDLFGKKATVLFGTTGASSETLAVSAGRFLIILATRGDTSFTFAVVYRYNNWKLEGTNTAGVTVDANTGQITLLNYTHYKIIY